MRTNSLNSAQHIAAFISCRKCCKPMKRIPVQVKTRFSRDKSGFVVGSINVTSRTDLQTRATSKHRVKSLAARGSRRLISVLVNSSRGKNRIHEFMHDCMTRPDVINRYDCYSQQKSCRPTNKLVNLRHPRFRPKAKIPPVVDPVATTTHARPSPLSLV